MDEWFNIMHTKCFLPLDSHRGGIQTFIFQDLTLAWKTSFSGTLTYVLKTKIVLSLFLLREEHKQGKGRERGGLRIRSRLCADSRAWCGAQTHDDLSWSQTLNRLTHTGASETLFSMKLGTNKNRKRPKDNDSRDSPSIGQKNHSTVKFPNWKPNHTFLICFLVLNS